MNKLIFTVNVFTKYCVPDNKYWRLQMIKLNGVEL